MSAATSGDGPRSPFARAALKRAIFGKSDGDEGPRAPVPVWLPPSLGVTHY